MFCPLLVIAQQVQPESASTATACREDACAWWLKEEKMCAVLGVVRVLAHHLANIAGNTARIGG